MTFYGRKIDEDMMHTIASYMDDSIREDLHCNMAPCEHEDFIKAYIEKDPEFESLLVNEFEFKW